jgi:hypothetical protein
VKPFTVRFSYVWPNERSSKRNIFIPWRSYSRGKKDWLKTQTKNFFLTELKKLVNRWNRCVEVEGVYAEQWY